MEGENKKYVRICNLCKKEFESRTRSEYCDKCRKWLYTKHYNEYPHTYEQYLHDECPQRMGNTRGTMNCEDAMPYIENNHIIYVLLHSKGRRACLLLSLDQTIFYHSQSPGFKEDVTFIMADYAAELTKNYQGQMIHEKRTYYKPNPDYLITYGVGTIIQREKHEYDQGVTLLTMYGQEPYESTFKIPLEKNATITKENQIMDSELKEIFLLIKKLQDTIKQVTLSNAPCHNEYTFNPANPYSLTMQIQPPTDNICETPTVTLNDVVYVELTRKEDTVELIVEYSDGMPERMKYSYKGIECNLLNAIKYSVDVSKILKKVNVTIMKEDNKT